MTRYGKCAVLAVEQGQGLAKMLSLDRHQPRYHKQFSMRSTVPILLFISISKKVKGQSEHGQSMHVLHQWRRNILMCKKWRHNIHSELYAHSVTLCGVDNSEAAPRNCAPNETCATLSKFDPWYAFGIRGSALHGVRLFTYMASEDRECSTERT